VPPRRPLPADFSSHRGPDREPAPGRLRLVEEFVNTANHLRGAELLTDGPALSRWLASRGLLDGDGADDADLRRAATLREALRALLRAPGVRDPAAAEALERAGARARLGLRVDADGSVRLVAAAPGVDGALGTILAAVHDASVDGSLARLRICRNDACRWAFYDHSRNGSAAWCSMTVCGTHLKARAYRRRRAGSAEVGG
jgi:predicted RNA-binding Zn ribbon-like protein